MWKFWKKVPLSILTLGITTSLLGAVLAVFTVGNSAGATAYGLSEQDEAKWNLLASIKVEETITATSYSTKKTYPDDLVAQANEFSITGYFVPLMAQGYQTQFIVVPDPANCPFCGTDSYGPSLEVNAIRPLPDLAEFARITVTGELEFIEDPETWQAVRLNRATFDVPES